MDDCSGCVCDNVTGSTLSTVAFGLPPVPTVALEDDTVLLEDDTVPLEDGTASRPAAFISPYSSPLSAVLSIPKSNKSVSI